MQDLIVPVVGDLGGEHALAAIADLMMQRGDHLSALYISNVETYLYGDKPSQFVKNVTRLPRDAHSVSSVRSLRLGQLLRGATGGNEFLSANRP